MSFQPFQPFRAFGGAAAPFSPLSLSPTLWLDDTGQDTAIWTDLSGHGRHWTSATATERPAIIPDALNGRQVRRFDGTNDWMSWPETAVRSVFVVYKKNALHADYACLFGRESNFGLYYRRIGESWAESYYAPLGWRGVGSEWRRSGETITPLADGSDPMGIWCVMSIMLSEATPTSRTRDRTIADRVPNADLAEVIFYDYLLSAGQRVNVEQYLGAKYGITVA